MEFMRPVSDYREGLPTMPVAWENNDTLNAFLEGFIDNERSSPGEVGGASSSSDELPQIPVPAGIPYPMVYRLRYLQKFERHDTSMLSLQELGEAEVKRLHHISVSNTSYEHSQRCYRVRICKTCSQENKLIELGTYVDQESAMLVNDAHEILCRRFDKLHVLVPSDEPYIDRLVARRVFRGALETRKVVDILDEKMYVHKVRTGHGGKRTASELGGATEGGLCGRTTKRLGLIPPMGPVPPTELLPELMAFMPHQSAVSDALRRHDVRELLITTSQSVAIMFVEYGLAPNTQCVEQQFELMLDALFRDDVTHSGGGLKELEGLNDSIHFPTYAFEVLITSYLPLEERYIRDVAQRMDRLFGRRQDVLACRRPSADKQLYEEVLHNLEGASFAGGLEGFCNLLQTYISTCMCLTWRDHYLLKFPTWNSDVSSTEETCNDTMKYSRLVQLMGVRAHLARRVQRSKTLLLRLGQFVQEVGSYEHGSQHDVIHERLIPLIDHLLHSFAYILLMLSTASYAKYLLQNDVNLIEECIDTFRWLVMESGYFRHLPSKIRSNIAISYLELITARADYARQSGHEPDITLKQQAQQLLPMLTAHVNELLIFRNPEEFTFNRAQLVNHEHAVVVAAVYLHALDVFKLPIGVFGEAFSFDSCISGFCKLCKGLCSWFLESRGGFLLPGFAKAVVTSSYSCTSLAKRFANQSVQLLLMEAGSHSRQMISLASLRFLLPQDIADSYRR